MKKKRESWIDAKLPIGRELARLLCGLSPREAAIVACSFLDSILGDLVAQHLRNDQKEVNEFLGFNGDGRAPAGSFGSRIQLAYLLSLIDAPELKALRATKSIRNMFAHRVVCSFDDPDVVTATKAVLDALEQAGAKYAESGRERTSDKEWQDQKTKLLDSNVARVGTFTGGTTVLITHLKKKIEANARRKPVESQGST